MIVIAVAVVIKVIIVTPLVRIVMQNKNGVKTLIYDLESKNFLSFRVFLLFIHYLFSNAIFLAISFIFSQKAFI